MSCLGAAIIATTIAAFLPLSGDALELQQQRKALAFVIAGWDAANTGNENVHFGFKRIELDRTFGGRRVRTGEVRIAGPNHLRAEYRENDRIEQTIVYLDDEIRIYEHEQQTIRCLPRNNKRGIGDERCTISSFLSGAWLGDLCEQNYWILRGLPVGEIAKKLEISLTKQDPHWVYVEIHPRSSAGVADFSRMQVVLSRDSHWVRRIWLEQPNGNEVCWDFEKPQPDKRNLTDDLDEACKHWKRIDIPAR
jgi:hypothetical protein